MVDVLVIGGGNAALCAALMTREAGAGVLLLEFSPRAWRGGNSQYTRSFRCTHDAPQIVTLRLDTASSGLALLTRRHAPTMPLLLAIHLGTVMALFATLPCPGGVYRSAALLKWSVEQRRPTWLGSKLIHAL
jgi:glycine/D-amino acid oxidase-like deaminating enzyme